VVSTLWSVPDEATAELVRRFYDNLLRHGEPPAAALRSAQRALRLDPRYREPLFWSGFVLQGEWR
jgi:CHAT domain-containing protein